MLPLDQQNAWREVYRATHPGWRPATELFADQVRAHLRPDARLLDLGCGRGGLVEQLDDVARDSYPASSLGPRDKNPVLRVIGIDPDFASLREHRLPALPRAAARSDRLPFAAGRFDVVAASWLLEHLVDPAATLAEVARVLRPGGAFVFITPNARHPLTWANRVAGRLGRAQGRLVARLYGRVEADTFPTAYRANTAATLAALAGAAGLALTDLRAVADPTYLAFSPALYRVLAAVEERLPAGRGIHLVGVALKP
ncbi:class I SAM-dependent methyltransferase [Promineifilum sp.]|uniref:class I SAM-dependent methyltransferase n=1 Tax=Promineifilum sp. TaxID=2664178 RepID=UPI0035B2FB42